MENISNNSKNKILKNVKELLRQTSGKNAPKTRKIEINKINVKIPGMNKIREVDVTYLKNTKELLSYIFANINRKPFINEKRNIYAFEILWLLLSILDEDTNKLEKMRSKDLFTNVTLNKNTINLMQFGKYEFIIPKVYKYEFDVSGYNLAKLRII